eukprot:GEZU01013192.1.p1 GENE.GEZU01013192.1~~GEZU01013192.1.p1  ORF type:complete len:142 (-),score=2.59 GEZU01013192.1:138-563(-)
MIAMVTIWYMIIHQISMQQMRFGQNARYTRDKPRFSGDLEVIKFLCKEFWMDTFKRQIDNLKTNHRGTFVLTDSKFRWLSRISAQTIDETQEAAAPFIIFPTGIIRGALSVLGVNAMVSAEVEFSQHSTPSCQFKVQVKPN